MEIISTLTISSDDLEELQKVFSIICSAHVPENSLLDQHSLSKKGIFSSTNMVAFIQALLKNPLINTEHIAPIIQLLSSKSTQEYGLITWNAFVQTMNDWITNVSCFSGIWKKKGIALGPLERKLFHCTIANFFLLKASSTSNTLCQLNYEIEQNGTRFDHEIISVEEKLESQVLFEEISKLLQNFDQLGIKIMQENTLQNMNAIFKLAISKANSPLDINRNSELISRTISLVLENGILKEILTILMKDEPLSLKSETLQMLSYVLYCCKLNNEYINGSLILRDPQVKDGLFHPDFHPAFLTVLLNLARYSNDFEAQQQSLICLGFIAQVNESSMNYISMEIVHNFSLYSAGEIPDPSLEALAFTIQSIVHSICNNSIHISDETLFALIEVGSKLLELRDLTALLETGFQVLAYALPRVKLTIERPFLYNTLKRIMDLLTLHSSLTVKKSAMMTLKVIIEGNGTQTEALLNANLLLVLSQIMTSNEESLKPLCCRILRILFRKSYVLQSIELNNLCTAIDVIRDVYNIPHCHWEAIRMVKEIVELGESYTFSLIQTGAVRMIIVNLLKFEEQDKVLREIYNFKGYYYNVPYLLDCLNILDVILSGRAIIGFESVLEILGNQLDKEVVNSLLSIVDIFIKEQDEFVSQCSRSYMKIYTDLEPKELLVNVMGHIVKIHETSQLETSKAVLLQIENYLSTFPRQKFTEEISDEFVLVIRFFTSEELNMGECRVVRLGSSSSLSELHQVISNEYGFKGFMTFKNIQKNEQNCIIDSEAKFKKSIKEGLESLNLARSEVEELFMCVLVEFAPVQSQQGLQCSQCRKIYHLAEFIKIDSYHGVCKRCFQILSSDMSEIFGKRIC